MKAPQKEPPGIFRPAAIEYLARSRGQVGEPLRLPEIQTLKRGLLLAALIVALGVGILFVDLGEVVQVTAVVRRPGRTLIRAPGSGIVKSVEVLRGDEVVAGSALFRVLPTDWSVRGGPIVVVRSPVDGMVSDLSLERGGYVSTSEVLAIVDSPDSRLDVLLVAPSRVLPRLAPGQPVVLTIFAFPDAILEARTERVVPLILTTEELKRVHPALSDLAEEPEGYVLVVAPLSESRGTSEQSWLLRQLQEGMRGVATIRMGSRRIISSLLPSNRAKSQPGLDSSNGSGGGNKASGS